MPLLRTLTLKIKTKLTPPSSPTSPTHNSSSHSSSSNRHHQRTLHSAHSAHSSSTLSGASASPAPSPTGFSVLRGGSSTTTFHGNGSSSSHMGYGSTSETDEWKASLARGSNHHANEGRLSRRKSSMGLGGWEVRRARTASSVASFGCVGVEGLAERVGDREGEGREKRRSRFREEFD